MEKKVVGEILALEKERARISKKRVINPTGKV